MADLIGEGRVDLTVRFTFSFAFSRSVMADEGVAASVVMRPGEEPLETESEFAADGMNEAPFDLIGEGRDWELILPNMSNQVCSEYDNYVFPMCFAGPSCHLPKFIQILMPL
jgi:hypothetical protein